MVRRESYTAGQKPLIHLVLQTTVLQNNEEPALDTMNGAQQLLWQHYTVTVRLSDNNFWMEKYQTGVDYFWHMLTASGTM